MSDLVIPILITLLGLSVGWDSPQAGQNFLQAEDMGGRDF